jgi:hypothetical protein
MSTECSTDLLRGNPRNYKTVAPKLRTSAPLRLYRTRAIVLTHVNQCGAGSTSDR